MLQMIGCLKRCPCYARRALLQGSRGLSTSPTPLDAPPPAQPRTTHFGAAVVPEEDKKGLVGDVFHRVADNYDVMNDLMSAGIHRLWKDSFVAMAGRIVSEGAWNAAARASRCTCEAGARSPSPPPHCTPSSPPPHPSALGLRSAGDRGTVVLDVAGGTGDIAFRLEDSMRRSFIRPAIAPRIIVTDINASMLQVGQERAAARAAAAGASTAAAGGSAPVLEWRVGDAESLAWVPDASVDLYTIAFGIRNCTRVESVLREAHRVLRPGGRFMCLEFSTVSTPVLSTLYEAYSANVIPALGAAVSGDKASYQYLVESIKNFPNQEAFADMIADAGFSGVDYTNFTLGVCAVHTGFKAT
jgi:2-methoxy-6-polyprenyl-1,4-benzoquinol methylase